MLKLEAERLAAQHLTDGRDLWADGGTIDDVLGEDGLVDESKIAALARDVTVAHPHYSRRQPSVAGLSSGTGHSEPTTTSWSSLIRGTRG